MEILAASYLLPIAGESLAGGAVAIENGIIVATGPLAALRREFSAPVTEFPGCVILPGLVNGHTHLELTHFPSWKLRKGIDYSPRTYVDWVIQVIKIHRALTHEELAGSLREGIFKSFEAGTTTVGDILTNRSLLEVYGQYPVSGRVFFEALGRDPVKFSDLLGSLDQTLSSFSGGNMSAGLSPHASHTLTPLFARQVAALARKHDVPMEIHLAESPEETTFIGNGSGQIAELLYPFVGWEMGAPAGSNCTPTAYLDSLGVLDGAAVVHCVHVTPADAEILKKRGAVAILCPRSNDCLVVGKAPAALLKQAGIPLALGTDSLASNDSLSMWDEMRFLLGEFPQVFLLPRHCIWRPWEQHAPCVWTMPPVRCSRASSPISWWSPRPVCIPTAWKNRSSARTA